MLAGVGAKGMGKIKIKVRLGKRLKVRWFYGQQYFKKRVVQNKLNS
jgi:hypothetical protein